MKLTPVGEAEDVRVLYHGSDRGDIRRLEPRKRFTPGSHRTEAPPAVYASDDPAYAAAHSFPWTTAEGIILGFERNAEGNHVVILRVPKALAHRLEQPVYLYALPAKAFELMPDVPPRGHNFRSLEAVGPLLTQSFPNVRAAIEEHGGRVELLD